MKYSNIFFYSKQKHMRNSSSSLPIAYTALFYFKSYFYYHELEMHNQMYLNFILYKPLQTINSDGSMTVKFQFVEFPAAGIFEECY